MKLWAALLLGAFVAAASAQTIFVEDGRELVFDTEAAASVGTMDYATHSAGFSYKMTTRVQIQGRQLNIQFSNARFSQFVGAHDAGAWPFDNTNYTPVNGDMKPFAIRFDDNGLFQELVIPSGASVFERNLFKGWASTLQINAGEIKAGNRGFKSKEKMLQGNCDVTYTVTPQSVRKTVSTTEDCEDRVYRLIDDYRSNKCDGTTTNKGMSYPSSLTSTTFVVKKDGGRFRLQKIVSTSSFIHQEFSEEGAAQFIFTNQTSTLRENKASSGDISPSGDSTSDIAFEWADQDFAWNKDRDLKDKEPFFATGSYFDDTQEVAKQIVLQGIPAQKRIIEELSKDREVLRKAHKFGINSILPAFYALNYDSLKSIADQLFADKSDTGVAKSNVFGELLGAAGTSAAALLVRDMVLNNQFANNRDAARILTSIPYHIRRPNTQLVKEYEQLLNADTGRVVKLSVPLVFGHLVRVTCMRAGPPLSPASRDCWKNFAAPLVQRFFTRYQQSNDRKEKGLILAGLANIRFGGQSKLLKPIIYGEVEEDEQLRTLALRAASWEATLSRKGVSYFLPVFANRALPHELRIGALEILMHSRPTGAEMSAVITSLYAERNYEVINYANALLQRWADSIDPCTEDTAHLAKYFLKYTKQFSGYEIDWGFGVSKTYARQFQKKKYGYGGGYMFYVIGSEKSFAPLSLGMTMSSNFYEGASKQYIFGVHLRLEGLAKKVIKKFKTTDPTTWKTADLEKILSGDMGIRERPDQPVRVQVTVSLKGNIIFHRLYDDESAKPTGELGKFIQEQMAQMGDTMNINHQRAVQSGSFLYEQPTSLGVPMAIFESNTHMLHFGATIKRGNVRGLLFRDIESQIHIFTQSSRGAMVRHPARKLSYGIVQDRIYHLQHASKKIFGLNPIKREIKISISRPSVEKPTRFFAHAATQVMVRGNNLAGDAQGLQQNCPQCQNRVVISRGPDAMKSRTFINRESEKRGYRVFGEYFDCEMNIGRKNTVGRLLAAFMPYNKSPRTAYNSVAMGLRQIRAFLIYWPRNEQCGAQIEYSQSVNNPVTGWEVSIRGNGEPNGEKLFFRGKKIFLKALIKAKGTPADRSYRLNVAYEYTPGNIENNIKVQLNRAPVPALGIEPYSLCFALENKYPDFTTEFLDFDENNDIKVTGKAMVQYGKADTCGAGEGEIRVNFEHSTTAEAREQLKNKWYYKQCKAQQNTPAWRGRSEVPVSEACFMSVYDATSARKYSWDIELVKVTDRAKRIAARVKNLVEAGLLSDWWSDTLEKNLDGGDGDIGPFLNLDVTLKEDETVADVKTETRRGVREYNDVPLRLDWTKRLRNLKFTKTLRRLFYMKLINPCILTSADVRTNDNVTYAYSPSTSWTLASARCGPQPDFAVFTKRSVGLPLAAKVYIGGHEVEFSPSGSSVNVKINGAAVNIAPGSQKEHVVDGVEILRVFRWGKSYHVYSFLRAWVSYDGHFVEVVPAPSAKGQACGICGNYNRNQFDEFEGKNGEQLGSAQELVQNYQWSG